MKSKNISDTDKNSRTWNIELKSGRSLEAHKDELPKSLMPQFGLMDLEL